MKPRLLVIAVLLSTLRATGADAPLTPMETEILKSIDALPTRAQIDFATQPVAGLDRLLAIAADSTVDLAIQIRAIRLLPRYCPSPGEDCSGTPTHDALLALVQSGVAALGQLSPQGLLRLRAAVEALGATRSGLDTDVAALTSSPSLLDHPSRDVRFTAVRALRDLGSCAAVGPLEARSPRETVTQVQQAILNALQNLHASQQCRL